MLSLQSYLNDPCAAASLPYWKQNRIAVPGNRKIIHDRDLPNGALDDYNDEPYFRLYHDLKNIKETAGSDIEIVQTNQVSAFVHLINACYSDLSVTAAQIEAYQQTPVYCPELWILLKEKPSGAVIAGGIADYDKEIGEGTLEWIQVLPGYRRRGYGQIVVNALLAKMQGVAKFATVSGKVNSPSNPADFYRKCGFTGNDIWHILTKNHA